MIKTPFKDAVQKDLPSKKLEGSFNGAANPSDGGSDINIPGGVSQYAPIAPAKPVPYATGRGPTLKIGRGE